MGVAGNCRAQDWKCQDYDNERHDCAEQTRTSSASYTPAHKTQHDRPQSGTTDNPKVHTKARTALAGQGAGWRFQGILESAAMHSQCPLRVIRCRASQPQRSPLSAVSPIATLALRRNE